MGRRDDRVVYLKGFLIRFSVVASPQDVVNRSADQNNKNTPPRQQGIPFASTSTFIALYSFRCASHPIAIETLTVKALQLLLVPTPNIQHGKMRNSGRSLRLKKSLRIPYYPTF